MAFTYAICNRRNHGSCFQLTPTQPTHTHTRTNRSTDRPSKETINFSDTTLQGLPPFPNRDKANNFHTLLLYRTTLYRVHKGAEGIFSLFLSPSFLLSHQNTSYSFLVDKWVEIRFIFFGFPFFFLFSFLCRTLRRTHERHRKIQLKKYKEQENYSSNRSPTA